MGPACWEVPQLEKLIDAGMSIARFNFSHGDHEGHKACLDRLRMAARNKDAHIGKFVQVYMNEETKRRPFIVMNQHLRSLNFPIQCIYRSYARYQGT